LETHLFWDQKVKCQGHESRRRSLHSCESWLELTSWRSIGKNWLPPKNEKANIISEESIA